MGTRNYDMVYVIKPDLDPEAIKVVVDRMSRRIQEQGGNIEVVDVWGKKRTSYRIRKFREGVYVHTRFALDTMKVAEIKRSAALTEEVLRATVTTAVGPTPQQKAIAAPPSPAIAPTPQPHEPPQGIAEEKAEAPPMEA